MKSYSYWQDFLEEIRRYDMQSYKELLECIINKYLGATNQISILKLHAIKYQDFSFTEKLLLMKRFIEDHEALAYACITQEHAKRISMGIYTGTLDLFYIEAVSYAINDDINKYCNYMQRRLFPKRTITAKIIRLWGVTVIGNIRHYFRKMFYES